MSSRSVAPFLLLLRRHPGKTLGVAACLAMGGTIVGNAVLFQSGRHPAPLFGHALRASQPAGAALPPPAPRPVASAVPMIRQIPMTPDRAPATEATTPRPPPPASTSTIRAPATKPVPARRADAIARLLHGTDQNAVATADVDPRIVAAQRSLAKLGFPVRPDGRMGGSTRRALEAFERDHHMAAGSELSQKVMRELAAAAASPPG